MDPRLLVQQLMSIKNRVKGWYETQDSTAIQYAINVIVHFCYPTSPRIIKTNGQKQFFCPRCNRKIMRTMFWCPFCGQRILVKIG